MHTITIYNRTIHKSINVGFHIRHKTTTNETILSLDKLLYILEIVLVLNVTSILLYTLFLV